MVGILLVALLATLAACRGPGGDPMEPPASSAAAGRPRELDPPLDFRAVTASQDGPCPTPVEGGGQLVVTDPQRPGSCLVLAPPELTVQQLAEVAARYDDRNLQWVVEINLAGKDVAALERISRAAANLTDPQNRIAMVLGTEVIIAPAVMSALTDGRLQISGKLTEQEAKDLQVKLGG